MKYIYLLSLVVLACSAFRVEDVNNNMGSGGTLNDSGAGGSSGEAGTNESGVGGN